MARRKAETVEERLAALERRMDRLEGKRRRIGFVETDARSRGLRGECEEQDPDEWDNPDEGRIRGAK